MRTPISFAVLGALLGGCAGIGHDGGYAVTQLVGPSPFHGVHGLAVEPDGTVLAGSVVGQAIYAVDPGTGAVSTRIGPPDGMADDIAFGPGGVMAWTGYLSGKVFAQAPGGAPRMVASGLPGANSLAFAADGTLYMTQVFLGDALYEVDWQGDQGARLIREGLGGLNGFEVGPDGMIYGPLWFKHAIVRVDPETGTDTVVADGFTTPAAANFGKDGRLYAIDTATGELKRIDLATKAVEVVARLAPALDNLAVGPSGLIYVSNMADAAIYEVDPETGSVRTVVSGPLAMPADLALYDDGERETLHVADTFAYRTVDTTTGAVADPLRMYRDALENPLGIGVGETKVAVASWAAGTVQIVDRESGTSLAIQHGFKAPVDTLVLADGRILVLEAVTGAISAVAAIDGHAADAPPPVVSGLNMPVAMADAGDGVLYVTEAAPPALARVDLATGGVVRVLTDMAGPEGVDVGADGRVYVAEVGARRLIAFDPETGTVTTLADGLEIGLAAPEGALPAYTTTGVAVSDRDGAVYVASDLTNAVYKVARKHR